MRRPGVVVVLLGVLALVQAVTINRHSNGDIFSQQGNNSIIIDSRSKATLKNNSLFELCIVSNS